MITCPNCGATARNGAKFCTTCGTKLTGILPTNPTSPATTATTSSESNQTPILSWPSVAEAAPTAAISATPESATPTSAVDWDWPAPFSIGGPGTEDGPTSDTENPFDTEAEEAPKPNGASAAFTSEQDDLSAWAAQWNAGDDVELNPGSSSTSERANNSTAEQPIDAPVERIDDILVELTDPPADSSNAPEDATDPGFETTSFGEERDEVTDSQVSEKPTQERTDEQEDTAVSERIAQPDMAAQEPVDAPAVPANDSIAASTATRATALLDELRDLLTASTSTEAGDTALPPEIASSLRDAMGAESSFDALRAVAVEASEHPRDLYAMMDLGRHAGDILTLIAERDRLRAAITHAFASRSSPED